MEEMKSGKGLSVAGMILGIIAVVFAWWYLLNILALVCGILGVVFACIGSKRFKAVGEKSGIATAGIVLSIIGLSLSVIGFLSCTLCVACAAAATESAVESAYDAALDSYSNALSTFTY